MLPQHKQPLQSRIHLRLPRRRSTIALLVLAIIVLILGARHLQRRSVITYNDYIEDLVYEENTGEVGFEGRVLRKALVIASFVGQSGLEWVDEVPSDWSIYRYVHAPNANDAQADVEKVTRQMKTVALPSNQGREALAYITFIATNYDDLPDVMLFTHGADRSWHAPARTTHRLRALNISALLSESSSSKRRGSRGGYVALRCATSPTCASKRSSLDLSKGPDGMGKTLSPVKLLPAFWAWVFPGDQNLPTRLAAPWGGEFAVSKAAVRRRPQKFWEKLKRALEGDLGILDLQLKEWSVERWRNPSPNSVGKDVFGGQILNANDAYVVGSLFQQMWHFMFGMEALYCPDSKFCEKTSFAGVIDCEAAGIDPDAFGGFHDWEDSRCSIDEKALQQIERENALLRWNEIN